MRQQRGNFMSIDPDWKVEAQRISDLLEPQFFDTIADVNSASQNAYNCSVRVYDALVHELAAAYTRGLLDGLTKATKEEWL